MSQEPVHLFFPRRVFPRRTRLAGLAAVAIFFLTSIATAPVHASHEAGSDASPVGPVVDPERERATPLSVRGIYLQQGTLQAKSRLDYLIRHSLRAGINTFVVDLWARSVHFGQGVAHVREAGIQVVPRITVFPEGGTREQVRDRAYWEDRWTLVEHALAQGVRRVQLDYVRYSSDTEPSVENARDIARVVRFFAERVRARGASLEIDVFGEVAFRRSRHIGQDIQLLAPEIDGVCPMVYPSHYEPFLEYAEKPFETVLDSLLALRLRMGPNAVPIRAYVELFNYRVPMTVARRADYIDAQLDAVEKAGVEGWYAWSAGNRYDILFQTLARRARRSALIDR